ncbi:hypothetical protein J3F83DRAFT_734469 [Trichoderma novae-zelandiae]
MPRAPSSTKTRELLFLLFSFLLPFPSFSRSINRGQTRAVSRTSAGSVEGTLAGVLIGQSRPAERITRNYQTTPGLPRMEINTTTTTTEWCYRHSA